MLRIIIGIIGLKILRIRIIIHRDENASCTVDKNNHRNN